MIDGYVDDSQFQEWITEIKTNFHSMVETMKKVARVIELTTAPYVPLDTSALEQSFDYMVVDNSPFILLGVGYDAVDEDSGFHYAQYQHDHHLNHPRRGIPFYLTVGIHDAKFEFFELIEQDYLSLFFGNKISSMSIGDNNHAHFIKYTNM
jgi:hypothetical protein